MSRPLARLGVLAGVLSTLVACGGGGGDGAPAPPPEAAAYQVDGHAVVSLSEAPDGSLLAVEQAARPAWETAPQPRRLVRIGRQGAAESVFTPPAAWSLVDAAVTADGEVTAVLTSEQRAVRLLRLGPRFDVVGDQRFEDAASAADPWLDEGGLFLPGALQPALMHDAARLVVLGEDIVLVLRTGLNAVVAYRLAHQRGSGFQVRWRQLVEPGATFEGRSLRNGSFDVFSSLDQHFRVHVAVADDRLGIAVVATPADRSLAAHVWHWGGAAEANHALLFTQLDAQTGRRIGASILPMPGPAELYRLKGHAGGWVGVGRLRHTQVEDGWDGWWVTAGRDGALATQRVDVDRGEILFDAVPAADGAWLLAGAAGYLQNPEGASVSEASTPLLARRDADGRVTRLPLADTSPRQDQLRTLLARAGGALWAGSLRDGPGTHSADGDPSLLRVNGAAEPLPAPPP